MQNVGSAVIAAAGLGSRIGLGMPKCMIEIDGVTILTRLLNAIRPHVSTIHLVVGYREDMVVEYCSLHHRDVVLVRNPDYRSTNTAYSFAKGAEHLKGKVIYIDGDLLIDAASLAGFFEAAKHEDILVGVTDAKSENAVFVESQATGDEITITGFTRDTRMQYEWANIVSGPNDLLRDANGYVYERLEEHLPLRAHRLKLAEVDTADDLDAAIQFARQKH